ncbi:GGDEF domain-containing protein [Pseudoxanthomonas sp. SGNA-20]|jgi:diguanylate cyclase (GGDEF) domain|uniref:diguanylate cyclase n=1 Tax=Pseudoxanthomonas taiwanensis J19 TaxID=935569 RepID=A0A562E4T0_9GAMM|nr:MULTISPECIES: GGDEF domain-containing protein [Pseudoxanthomonas]RRN54521.1 GGDEF domain-containing protein [Pseudoxanthomonas sp. SGNA-20]TWH16830.1 diguanylate cyclase (GGDEF)-like protein [Pseudoxanthomonas taiwanensis J19]
MVATVLVGMLCVYSLSFAVMFLLIGRRLGSDRMGMDAFAAGNLILGVAYVLQLMESPGWGWMGVVNHCFTLGALVAYCIGGARFFGKRVPLLLPLCAVVLGYAALQAVVHWGLGAVARYALLSAVCSLCFAFMIVALLLGLRSYARNLRGEVVLFVLLIGGILVLNLMKLGKLVDGGLEALDMDARFQMVFYIYMCSLATIMPPSFVWLVLRRLTDQLRGMAARDPLTRLLNRRGLAEALEACFQRPGADARLLMIDVDHFKRINDRHGHQAGDAVLCAVATVLRGAVRPGDLVCRMGGEEFAVVCPGIDAKAAWSLAERIRGTVEAEALGHDPAHQALRCTVTIGISGSFASTAALEQAMQAADAALYRGKKSGRNRIEAA